MTLWLRLYTDILNDEKVHFLSAEHFRGWVFLLCVAKEHDGVLPDIRRIAFRLRTSETEAKELIQELKRSGLLDEVDGKLIPHNWDKRQYKDPTAADRMRKHRNGDRNTAVTETVTLRPTEQSTESETEPESEQSRGVTSRGKPRSASRRPQMCDDEWLTELQANPAYEMHDVRRLYHRMVEWCRLKHKQPTRGRLLNWLNREDKPLAPTPKKPDPGANKPAGYTLEEAARLEQTFDWDGWTDSLIHFNDRGKLEMERKLIAERGGPKEPWEHRVYEYLNAATEAT